MINIKYKNKYGLITPKFYCGDYIEDMIFARKFGLKLPTTFIYERDLETHEEYLSVLILGFGFFIAKVLDYEAASN